MGDALLRSCDVGGVPGFDTETIGCDPAEESPVNTASVVLWSVGIPGPKTALMHPKGYRPSQGWVLPPAALGDKSILEWLRAYPKTAHNNRYDLHSLMNEGVEVGGDIFDTVDIFRVCCPGLMSYRLKDLIPDYCGYEVLGKFRELFRRHKISTTVKRYSRKVCPVHGVQPNKYRKCPGLPDTAPNVFLLGADCIETLVKEEWTETENKELEGYEPIPLQEICSIPALQLGMHLDIRPGEHPLWPLLVKYSGLDSIGGADLFQVADHLTEGNRKAKVPCEFGKAH